VYGRQDLPLHIDMGCGKGRMLLELSKMEPERNFLGKHLCCHVAAQVAYVACVPICGPRRLFWLASEQASCVHRHERHQLQMLSPLWMLLVTTGSDIRRRIARSFSPKTRMCWCHLGVPVR